MTQLNGSKECFWNLLSGVLCITLALSIKPLEVAAADLRGRVDTIHGYASNLFPAERIEVALVSLATKKLAGRTFTSTDGRYYVSQLLRGEHWLLIRPDPQAAYWTNRIQVDVESVNLAPLFIGELALGYSAEGAGAGEKWTVYPVGETTALQHVKCVDYEVTTVSGNEKRSVCNPPFAYRPEKDGLYHFYAGVRFDNGAYRGIARTIRHPYALTSTSRIITVGPCPTALKLVSLAEEREGVRLAMQSLLSSSAGGKIEPFKPDRERVVMYHPPTLAENFLEDHFEFVITREKSTAKGGVTVRLLDALRPGCPVSLK